MLSSILVSLDGSVLAESALPYAKALARRSGARLILIRAARSRSPLGDLTYDSVHQTMAEAEGYLVDQADELVEEGFSVEVGVPYAGSAAEWIVEEADFRHADLIVMATHDRVGPNRWIHGSVAEAVVHSAKIPVMLVEAKGAAHVAQRLLTAEPVIVVPLDGSELAEAALPLAKEFGMPLVARTLLVGVVPNAGQMVAGLGGAILTFTGEEHAKLEADARAYLEANTGRVGSAMGRVEAVLRYGDPATEIAGVAEEYGAAAVIMATHGRTGLVRSVLGSVAGGVIHRSNIPVVLIRPPELRPAEQPLVAEPALSKLTS